MKTTIEVKGKLRPILTAAAYGVIFLLSALADTVSLYGVSLFLRMAAVGIYTVILMTVSPLSAILCGAASLGISFAVSGVNTGALLPVIVHLILALVLSSCIRRKSAKSTSAVVLCLVLLLCGAVSFSILYVANGNTLSLKAILDDIRSTFDSIKSGAISLVDTYFASLPEDLLKAYAESGVDIHTIQGSFAEVVALLVDTIEVLLPALLIVAAEIAAYLATVFFDITVRLSRLDALLPEPKWVLFPTQISCVVFMVTTLLYVISSFFGAANAFSVVITNLLLILLPSMAACGIRGLVVRLKHPLLRRKTVLLLILFLFFSLFTAGMALPFGIVILAFLGARDVSTLRIAEAANNKK